MSLDAIMRHYASQLYGGRDNRRMLPGFYDSLSAAQTRRRVDGASHLFRIASRGLSLRKMLTGGRQ